MRYKIGDIGFMNVDDGVYKYDNKLCKICRIYSRSSISINPYVVEFMVDGYKRNLCISEDEFKLKVNILNINKYYKRVN